MGNGSQRAVRPQSCGLVRGEGHVSVLNSGSDALAWLRDRFELVEGSM